MNYDGELKDLMSVEKTYEMLTDPNVLKSYYKNRNTIGWALTLGGCYVKGWHSSEPHLNDYASKGKLNKPGYNTCFPQDLRIGMGHALMFSANCLRHIASASNITVPFIDFNQRNEEFSKELSKLLGNNGPVFFEGCAIKLATENVSVHVDKEN